MILKRYVSFGCSIFYRKTKITFKRNFDNWILVV